METTSDSRGFFISRTGARDARSRSASKSESDSFGEFLLNELETERLPENSASRLPHLKKLDFIQEKHNVLLIESPGTGKTHIAIGLGI
ncbi:ATP-binding protein [Ureibacillus massiliensis]|uniref:ATP-binding protein n=1 Tax=Ureibacillus massiliensis TaxID=292806 RepID=UPI000689D3A4|nr:ATP-binding protein [Ureibacillus massiliensis]